MKGAKRKNGSDHVHSRRLVRASTCISRKIYGCKNEGSRIIAYDTVYSSRCCQIHRTFSFLFPCIDSKLFLFGMCETGVIASLEAGCSP